MTARNAPADPLVVILGSTGTGKSELAVELATRFNGEIINADAMQMYKGLPIITNKITTDERCGVPHHLLDHIGLDQPTWDVEDFKREASKVISEIRSRGNLPIVVGGTHYYTTALLFEDQLVVAENEKQQRDGEPNNEGQDGGGALFPILNEPTEVILAKLREVDPIMADRWHPNDRRKISRSLEIYLQHGRPASEIYAEQRRRKAAENEAAAAASPWETLLFWVHADPEVLKERLDKRVDKMLTAGLEEETQSMYEYIQAKEAAGEKVDYTRGIWQSIGFKEFEPYLKALNNRDPAAEPTDAAGLEALKMTGLEDMKTSTRHYARYQTRWIRLKTVPLLQEQPGAMEHLFVMDSTDVSQWARNVAEPAADIARRFLEGEALPDPASISEAAAGVLRDATTQAERTMMRRTCDMCQTTCVTEQDWTKHVKSRRHNVLLKRTKRRALVPAGERPLAVVPVEGGGDDAAKPVADERASSPEMDGLDMFDAPS